MAFEIQRMIVTNRSQRRLAIKHYRVTEFHGYAQKAVQLEQILVVRKQPGPGCKLQVSFGISGLG